MASELIRIGSKRKRERYRKRKHKKMVSREQKRAALHEKLQLLRSVTNSHAVNIPCIFYLLSFFSFHWISLHQYILNEITQFYKRIFITLLLYSCSWFGSIFIIGINVSKFAIFLLVVWIWIFQVLYIFSFLIPY